MRRGLWTIGWAAALAVMLGAAAPVPEAPPVAAATAPTLADPGAVLVSEVVVRGKEPGPAWWRAVSANSTVYILGVPDGPVPPVDWDRTVLRRRLAGATAVIGEPGFKAGIGDLFGILRLRSELKAKGSMTASLPPALAARWTAAAGREGKDPNRFDGWQPMAAGAFLLRESHKGWRAIEPQVREESRKVDERLQTPVRYPAMPLAQQAVVGLTPKVNQDCLGWALDDVEGGEARARHAAERWAAGDVSEALSAPRGFDRCLLVLTGGAALWSRMNADQAAEIARALKVPGHAVAVVSLRRLLSQDGVLARLEAMGVEVKAPGVD